MSKRLLAVVQDALDDPPPLEYIVARDTEPGPHWLLLLALGLGVAGLGGLGVWLQTRPATPLHARSQPHDGFVMPAPSDPGWVDYYRSNAEAVSMAVHLPPIRLQDEHVVWEKFVQGNATLIALSEVHYDCRQRTRRAIKMAVYRQGVFSGYAYDPEPAAPVAVEPDTVEEDALGLVCFGKAPESVDDPGADTSSPS